MVLNHFFLVEDKFSMSGCIPIGLLYFCAK